MRIRVKRLVMVKASSLIDNEDNWRVHGEQQTAAVKAALDRLGLLDVALAREREDGKLVLIDGHLRKKLAGDAVIPVVVTDLSEEEAKEAIVTLDPLSALADTDDERLRALLEGIKFDEPELAKLMQGLSPLPLEPGEFSQFDEPEPLGSTDIVGSGSMALRAIVTFDSRREQKAFCKKFGIPYNAERVTYRWSDLNG